MLVRNLHLLDVLLCKVGAGGQGRTSQQQLPILWGLAEGKGQGLWWGVWVRQVKAVWTQDDGGALRDQEASVGGQRWQDTIHRQHGNLHTSIAARPPVADDKSDKIKGG